MKCDRCEQTAGIEIVVMKDGADSKTMHLCAGCAQDALIVSLSDSKENPEGFLYYQDNLKKLLGAIFDETEEAEGEAQEDEHHCSFCGSSYADIMHTGRFGCDRCYVEFQDRIRETLRMTQGATSHIGDVPPSYKRLKEIHDEIEKKKQLLNDLILSEDYETAAVLRDEVKLLHAALKEEEA